MHTGTQTKYVSKTDGCPVRRAAEMEDELRGSRGSRSQKAVEQMTKNGRYLNEIAHKGIKGEKRFNTKRAGGFDGGFVSDDQQMGNVCKFA